MESKYVPLSAWENIYLEIMIRHGGEDEDI
jgi:hypothetical protein